ncbi:uncharacterized protein [Anoplolepis gracilipes]|uniref:uncharacterized protein n=1 Tax=Anoplolepis gracilipes TaxID=354296 RepID=UPI003BA046AA
MAYCGIEFCNNADEDTNGDVALVHLKWLTPLVIAKEPIRCKLVVNDHIIKQVMSFNYLGVETYSGRYLLNKARTQTNNKAARIAGCLRDIIWRNKYMTTKSKIRIYKTCIRPVLTYAAETRAETSKTKRMMRTTEMRILRTIKGVSLRDRIRSSDIRREFELQDVVRWTRARRRFWRDHVDRMRPEQLPNWAKIQKLNTRRAVGRPPKRWYESWTSGSQEGNTSGTDRT